MQYQNDCQMASQTERQAKVNDHLAKQVEKIWKAEYKGATLLPVVGIPSKSGGVGVLTHTMDSNLMRINGLESKSPLSNNALYSFESIAGKFVNLYEIMVPDLPGRDGQKSTGQIYLNALRDNGLDVAGVHFHWTGGSVFKNDKMVLAVHHQKIDMDPKDFSRRTIKAQQTVMSYIDSRMKMYMPMPLTNDEKSMMVLSDQEAQAVVQIWKAALPDSTPLPGIGLPSQGGGVLTLTHTYNGLESKSPLSNNALYSAEISNGKYINLYEVLVADIAGANGQRSTSQVYIDALRDNGLEVSAIHFHWTGSSVYEEDSGVVAIHHYNIGMTAADFSNRTIAALKTLNAEIARRLQQLRY
jgi:virulence-associated protein VapD